MLSYYYGLSTTRTVLLSVIDFHLLKSANKCFKEFICWWFDFLTSKDVNVIFMEMSISQLIHIVHRGEHVQLLKLLGQCKIKCITIFGCNNQEATKWQLRYSGFADLTLRLSQHAKHRLHRLAQAVEEMISVHKAAGLTTCSFWTIVSIICYSGVSKEHILTCYWGVFWRVLVIYRITQEKKLKM